MRETPILLLFKSAMLLISLFAPVEIAQPVVTLAPFPPYTKFQDAGPL